MFQQQKILVTGGAGFIGSHLADRLVRESHALYIIDDLSGGFRRNINKKAKFINCDLRDSEKTRSIVSKIKPRIIFHLAANAAENKSQFSPIDIASRNYNCGLNVLVPAISNGLKRFVFVSSIAVYGALQTPFMETDKPEPKDLYGISKFMMEESIKILADVHEFEYVIVRPHNVYGPRQNITDPYRNVVTIFMNQLLKKKSYYIYGDGKQKRCFTYVDDIIEPLYRCGFDDVNGRVFNLGSDKNFSVNELSNLVQRVSGIHVEPIHIADREHEVKVAISDHRQAKKYLHYKDTVSLCKGLSRTWEYVKAMGPQKSVFTKIEIPSKKLPTNWGKNI